MHRLRAHLLAAHALTWREQVAWDFPRHHFLWLQLPGAPERVAFDIRVVKTAAVNVPLDIDAPNLCTVFSSETYLACGICSRDGVAGRPGVGRGN